MVIKKLPNDLHTLYSQLNTEKIFPHELREDEIFDIYPPSSFQDPRSSAYAMTAQEEWDMVQGWLQDAADCHDLGRHKDGWMAFVYVPILRYIFDSKPLETDVMVPRCKEDKKRRMGTRLELVTSARIAVYSAPWERIPGANGNYDALPGADDSSSATELLPTLPGNISTKKLDFVVVLDLNPEEPFQRLINNHILGMGSHHVNQTQYEAIKRSLVAVSIKMTLASKDPMVQLAYWTAAWHKRMASLRRNQGREAGPADRLVSLPLIQVVRHQWSIYYAVDMGTSIKIYGPQAIGSTSTGGGVGDIYALISSLRSIKQWIETTYRRSMESWFGLTE